MMMRKFCLRKLEALGVNDDHIQSQQEKMELDSAGIAYFLPSPEFVNVF